MVKGVASEFPVRFEGMNPDVWSITGEQAWAVKPISYKHPPEVVSVEVAQYIIAGFMKAKIGDAYGGTRHDERGWECWLHRNNDYVSFWSTSRHRTEFEAIVAAYIRWRGLEPAGPELVTDGPLGTPYTRPFPMWS